MHYTEKIKYIHRILYLSKNATLSVHRNIPFGTAWVLMRDWLNKRK